MDLKHEPLITLFLVCLCILEISKHNKRVRESFPDQSDQQQSAQRRRFTLSYLAHGVLLVYTATLLIYQLFTGNLL